MDPGGNPSLVLGIGLAVREVELVVEMMVLALHTNHLEQVEVGRTCGNNTVNDGITGQHIVHQQWVGS